MKIEINKYNLDLSYIINQLGEDRENYFNSVAPPIIQTSNFAFKNIDDMKHGLNNEREISCYTRGKNPTVDILRIKIAALELTEDALILSSGVSAVSLSVLSQVKSGDHIVCVSNPYSWTYKFMSVFLARFNIEVDFVDGKNPDKFLEKTKINTKVYFMESPNSFTFEIQDIEAITKMAKERNIITILDNSYSSPLGQNPSQMGVDIIVHSATKYINGHSDIVAGAVCSSTNIINQIFSNEYMTLGNIISPNDAWLMIRGLRTLEIRMERIKSTTERIISYLDKSDLVSEIMYPFYHKSPQLELAKKQMKFATGLFTIKLTTNDENKIRIFCDSIKRFLLAVSWGGYESLMLPSIIFSSPTIPNNLIRFSIGLEDADILINDLDTAFNLIK